MNYYATGSATMSESVEPTNDFRLLEVRVNLDSAATQDDFTITLDSERGATFDLLLYTKAMAGVSDISVNFGDGHYHFNEGDKIVVAFANNDTRTWTLDVITDPIALQQSIAL